MSTEVLTGGIVCKKQCIVSFWLSVSPWRFLRGNPVVKINLGRAKCPVNLIRPILIQIKMALFLLQRLNLLKNQGYNVNITPILTPLIRKNAVAAKHPNGGSSGQRGRAAAVKV